MPVHSRRQFLNQCSLVSVAAVLAPVAYPTATWAYQVKPVSDNLDFSTFAAQLNTRFRALPESKGSIDLHLVEAHDLFSKGKNPALHGVRGEADEAFSLIFRGPKNSPLEQGTYSFQHSNMGTFAMFIVPLDSKDQTHFEYQAIFNRLNQA